HEFGHTLGLDHPKYLDIRGKGVPGIMYPRGTLVDPPYQYDPEQRPGLKGGTLHPQYRRVLKEDILNLKLHRLNYRNNKAVIGAFTNVYHWDHAGIN
nr:peptidase M10 [Flavisolibacter sp.]